ncbi:ABC transporter substrate-binding protein [Arthrobacter sp. NEB 688]|uniref:ABC transporter substrate-binding protein n=1 Tax=Arthrobacter sp. NEB 688 TaxID=904039 RepID=UPI0015665B54|nr:ABC transporter substrate-binding protein [Arthrobacter sp. NEB 688]QKE83944.1 ABC transporter substrate-binding protein [Arthrobacter sp. NEB 688]
MSSRSDRRAEQAAVSRSARRRAGRRRPTRAVVGLVLIVVAALVGAGVVVARQRGDATDPDTLPTSAVGDRVETRGGTLSALSLGPVPSWDPQRIASRADMAFAGRVFARTLTAFAPSTDPAQQSRLVGDLATDTGTASSDLKTWSFTLRDGLTWQDGSELTCEDVAYGISRTFATDVVKGGPTDALAVLAIPRQADGSSTYDGPYGSGEKAKAAQAAFDKAVTCEDRQITFTLSTPVGDFAEMLSQPAFGPVKRSADRREDGTYDVFSSGPYMLRGAWERGRGGLFVRNPHWDAASDPVRKAYPDQIRYQEGLDTEAVAQQVTADNAAGRSSVALGSVPPAIQQQVTAVQSLDERSVNPLTGVVDYLVPNVRSTVFEDEKVRLALAAATNRDAYVTAIGGATAAQPSISLLPSALPSAHDDDPVGTGLRGDPTRAKALLAEAKVEEPVEFTLAYRSDPTADKAVAALVAGWRQAGFAPTLKPITESYFSTIAEKSAVDDYDLFWSNWAPAWPSGSTVLPPLFDSTINITAEGPGRDYGYFSDRRLDEQMAKTSTVADRTARERGWADVDRRLLQQGAYIGLAERRALYVAGSDVRNLSANAVLGGVVELADIAVVP